MVASFPYLPLVTHFVHEWWLGRWPAAPTAAPASPHPSASLVSPVLPQAGAAFALPPGAVGFPKVSVRKQCLEFPCMPSALRCGSSLAPFSALKLRTAGTWGQGRAWCSPQQVGCLSGPAASLQGQGQADTAGLGHAVLGLCPAACGNWGFQKMPREDVGGQGSGSA